MQNNREQIDDFLRGKLQDVQFPIDENHWADAERRLDEDDDKKKPFWFLFLAVVLLVGAGITALTQIGDRNKNVAVNEVSKSQPTTTQNNTAAKNTSATQAENNTATQDDNVPEETIPSINSTSDNNNEQTKTENEITKNTASENTASRTAAFKQKTKTEEKNIVVQSTTNGEKNIMAANIATEKRLEKKTLARNKSKKTTDETSVAITNHSAKPEINNTTVASAVALSQKDKTLAKNKTTENTASAKNATIKDIDKTTTQTPTTDNGMAMLGNTRVYKTPEDYQRLNPRYIASLANYNYTETSIALDKPTSDSIRQEVEKLQTAKAAKKKERDLKIYEQGPSTFFLVAGAAAAKGYKGNQTKSPAWGLSPSLGLGYEATFSDRMSMYLSVYMSYISHLNIKETGASVTYSFDKDSTLLSVTRKNLVQMHIPLQLSYKLLPRLSMTGGLGINLGLNTISLYEDAKQHTAQSKFGYTDGLRFMDINANFGYDYNVTKRLTLGIFYQQGFLDMTKNDYFNNKQRDINARGGMLLRYKFNK